jgi:hypothetical protein
MTYEAAVEIPARTTGSRQRIYWGNLFSLRVWFLSLFLGALGGTLGGMLWAPLNYVVFIPLSALLFIGFMMSPSHCDACRSRIKLGASRCRRCGQGHPKP